MRIIVSHNQSQQLLGLHMNLVVVSAHIAIEFFYDTANFIVQQTTFFADNFLETWHDSKVAFSRVHRSC